MKTKEWQKGNESELLPLERVVMMNEWLKSVHQEFRNNNFNEEKDESDNKVQYGFIDD